MNRLFTIPGNPMGKQRARTGQGYSYTPDKTKHYETLVKELYTNNFGSYQLMQGPVSVIMHAYFSRPKSHYGTGKNELTLKPSAPTWHTSKPDSDNIEKIILDALNGFAYKDDSQVCELTICKRYIDNHAMPYTSVRLTPLEDR